MKSIKEKLSAECRSEDLAQTDKRFLVKYLGSQSKLGKDFKDVERAVSSITEEAFTKKKRKQLSINYTLHITEQNVSLSAERRNYVFNIPVEKLSYSFHAKWSYYILSLAMHVSPREVDVFAICCDSSEKLNNINMTFYYVFKGRRFALLRAKRQKERNELITRMNNEKERLKEGKTKVDSLAKKENSKDNNGNTLRKNNSFPNHDDDNYRKVNSFAVHNNISQVVTEPKRDESEGYYADENQEMYINRQTAIIDIHQHSTSKTVFDNNTSLVSDATREQFDRSARSRYPRSSWC